MSIVLSLDLSCKCNVYILKEQSEKGNNDLRYMLNDFRKRLKPEDVKKFDYEIFNIKPDKQENDILPFKEKEAIQKYTSKTLQNYNVETHPKWVKTLYKKIVVQTHPDKIENLKIDTLKNKLISMYMDTVDAYNKKEYAKILLVSEDLGIKFTLTQEMQFYINNLFKKYQKLYNESIRSVGYSWYHVPENKKEEFLKRYLKKMGYEINDNQISQVLKNIKQRKVGTRPKKNKR